MNERRPSTAYYEDLGGGRYTATPATVGPWSPKLSHGSPPAALLLHEIDRAHARADMRVARISFDFFGPVAVDDVQVTTEIVRPGARIELVRAQLSVGGRVAMVASAWRVATAAGRAPAVSDERVAPVLPGPQTHPMLLEVPSFGYGESLDCRFVHGAFDALGPATMFARPRVPLLAGEPISALERILLLVDSANGISAPISPLRFTFVPVELSVGVRRHPRTEWVGMSATTTVEADGVGHTVAELFDEEGYFGTAFQTLFVAPR